jgi:hypothetical protein
MKGGNVDVDDREIIIYGWFLVYEDLRPPPQRELRRFPSQKQKKISQIFMPK